MIRLSILATLDISYLCIRIEVVICIDGGCFVETAPEVSSMEYLSVKVFDALRNAMPCGINK